MTQSDLPLMLVYIAFNSKSIFPEKLIELVFWQNVNETFHDTLEKE